MVRLMKRVRTIVCCVGGFVIGGCIGALLAVLILAAAGHPDADQQLTRSVVGPISVLAAFIGARAALSYNARLMRRGFSNPQDSHLRNDWPAADDVLNAPSVPVLPDDPQSFVD
jgi:hypothetical protein